MTGLMRLAPYSSRSECARSSQNRATRVVLDLSSVGFLDSSGLGAVVAVMKALGPVRRLELSGLTPTVEKVFRLTRMDSVFIIHKVSARRPATCWLKRETSASQSGDFPGTARVLVDSDHNSVRAGLQNLFDGDLLTSLSRRKPGHCRDCPGRSAEQCGGTCLCQVSRQDRNLRHPAGELSVHSHG